jgi:hypothetical protein
MPGAASTQAVKIALSYEEPVPTMLASAAFAAGARANDATRADAAKMPAKERFIYIFSLFESLLRL